MAYKEWEGVIPQGEYGGGIEIAMKALHMVNYAWIKRIPPTALTDILINALGAKDEMDLMEGLSNKQYHLYPFIAIEVIQAARDGDPPHLARDEK